MENVSKHAIKEVCELVDLYDYIQLLPKKYATVIGIGEHEWSNSQKQKLALARLLLRVDCKVVVLDDPTIFLTDSNVRRKIIKMLKNKLSEKTVIVLSSHKSTIEEFNCDIKYYLNNSTLKVYS